MSKQWMCAIAFVGTLSWSASTAAQEATLEAMQTAAKHFQAGAESYTGGDYSKAIIEFLQAYNAVPNALFLYNISLSYAKLHNFEDALAAARKARMGEGLDDETANRNIARIAAYEIWTSATQVSARAEEVQVAVVPEVGEEPSAKKRFGALGYSGAALALAGTGLIIGSGAIAGGMKADIDAYEEAGRNGDRAAYDRLRTDLDSRQTTGKILLFSGAAVASVGLIFVLIDLATGGETQTSALWIAPLRSGVTAGFAQRF